MVHTSKPNEGEHDNSTLISRWIQPIFLAVMTAGILACAKSLFTLNITVTQIQEQNILRTLRIDDVQQGVNDLRLDMKDARERLIRIEEKKK